MEQLDSETVGQWDSEPARSQSKDVAVITWLHLMVERHMVAARKVLILFPFLLLTVPVAQAQQAASYLNIAPVSPLFGPGPTSDRRVSIERRSTYWVEGGGAGAAVLGILGILFAARGCADLDLRGSSNNCVGPMLGSALLGAGLGFTIGALVGARVPKQ